MSSTAPAPATTVTVSTAPTAPAATPPPPAPHAVGDAPAHSNGSSNEHLRKELTKLCWWMLGAYLLIICMQLAWNCGYKKVNVLDMNGMSLVMNAVCVLLIGAGYMFIQKSDSPHDTRPDFFGFVGLAMIIIGGVFFAFLYLPTSFQEEFVHAGSMFREKPLESPQIAVSPTGLELEVPKDTIVKEWFITLRLPADQEPKSANKKSVTIPTDAKKGEVFYTTPADEKRTSKANSFARP